MASIVTAGLLKQEIQNLISGVLLEYYFPTLKFTNVCRGTYLVVNSMFISRYVYQMRMERGWGVDFDYYNRIDVKR